MSIPPTTSVEALLYSAGDDALRFHARRRQYLSDPLQRSAGGVPGDRGRQRQRRRGDGRLGHLHRRDRRGRSGGGRRRATGTDQPRQLRDQRRALHDHRPAQWARTTAPAKWSAPAKPPSPFTGPNTFKLSDPGITYTLHLDDDDLPADDHRELPGAAEPRPDLGGRRDLRHHLRHRHYRVAAGAGAGGDPHHQLRLHPHQSVRCHHGQVHLRRRQHLRRGVGGRPVHCQPDSRPS